LIKYKRKVQFIWVTPGYIWINIYLIEKVLNTLTKLVSSLQHVFLYFSRSDYVKENNKNKRFGF